MKIAYQNLFACQANNKHSRCHNTTLTAPHIPTLKQYIVPHVECKCKMHILQVVISPTSCINNICKK